MEVTLQVYISTVKVTVSLKTTARTILPKTLTTLTAVISRNAQTVPLQAAPSLVIKEIAGLNLAIQSGRSNSMALSKVLTI